MPDIKSQNGIPILKGNLFFVLHEKSMCLLLLNVLTHYPISYYYWMVPVRKPMGVTIFSIQCVKPLCILTGITENSVSSDTHISPCRR